MNLVLTRFAYLESCTLGWLVCGSLKLATLERPWMKSLLGPGGKEKESCVPDGRYNLFPHSSVKFPDVYCLVNEKLGVYASVRPANQAWGRVAILIHPGNFVTDVIGCIAIGLSHRGECVVESRKAMVGLRVCLGSDKHSLLIQPMTTDLENAA